MTAASWPAPGAGAEGGGCHTGIKVVDSPCEESWTIVAAASDPFHGDGGGAGCSAAGGASAAGAASAPDASTSSVDAGAAAAIGSTLGSACGADQGAAAIAVG